MTTLLVWREDKHNEKPCIVRFLVNASKRQSQDEFMHIMNELDISPEMMEDQSLWIYDFLHYHTKVEKPKKALCLCGRRIKHILYLFHKQREMYYQVCFECVSNLMPWMEKLVEVDKERYSTAKLLGTINNNTKSELYRMCLACKEKKIHFSMNSKKIRCKECFVNMVPVDKTLYRACKGCMRLVIRKTEPEYRRTCVNCFAGEKTPYCIHCEGSGIALFDEETFRVCTECFT